MNRKAIAAALIGGGVLYLAVLSQPDGHPASAVGTPLATPSSESQLSTGPAGREPSAASNQGFPLSSGARAAGGPERSFGGYGCSGDCSGHQAGYDWAEEHDIDDEGDCETAGDNSNSPSFAEGCKAYINGENADDDSAGAEDQDADQEDENSDR